MLSDRVATGEPLSSDERAFQRAHERECSECSAEARVWLALGRAREDPTVLDEAAVWAPQKPSSKLRRARPLAVLAVLTVATLAAAVPAGLRRLERVARVANVASAAPSAQCSAPGRAELGGASATTRSPAPFATPGAAKAVAPEATARRVAADPSGEANTLSAEELLARARSLRAAGRALDASQAYRHLIATWPRSAEARVGLISLGELELSELSAPAAALRDFSAYLKTRGNLEPEARYGRIRALGRLGRQAEELSEARAFVRDYPTSPQASDLRARLSL